MIPTFLEFCESKEPFDVICFGGDDDDYEEYRDQAWSIAKQSPINILRDKELNAVIVVNGEVAGALFDAWNREEYSFDVVVAPKYQRRGMGKKLIDVAMDSFRDSDIDNASIKAEVVEPNLIPTLTKLGFIKLGTERGITIMTYGL